MVLVKSLGWAAHLFHGASEPTPAGKESTANKGQPWQGCAQPCLGSTLMLKLHRGSAVCARPGAWACRSVVVSVTAGPTFIGISCVTVTRVSTWPQGVGGGGDRSRG